MSCKVTHCTGPYTAQDWKHCHIQVSFILHYRSVTNSVKFIRLMFLECIYICQLVNTEAQMSDGSSCPDHSRHEHSSFKLSCISLYTFMLYCMLSCISLYTFMYFTVYFHVILYAFMYFTVYFHVFYCILSCILLYTFMYFTVYFHVYSYFTVYFHVFHWIMLREL